MSNKMVIIDENIEMAAEFCKKSGEKLNEMYNQYMNSIQAVRDNALISGVAANCLNEFISCAAEMQNKIQTITTISNATIKSYLNEIDGKDKL